MGKYSSDSDNDRRSNKSLKNRSRYRTSSSDSSDSRKNRRSAKKSHRRSRSKERYSRSGSYTSKSRSHRAGRSRDRYRSRRSRSKSYIKEYTSKPKRSSSSSSSSSDRSRTKKRPEKSKPNNKPKPVVVDDDDDCVIVDSETIQQINEDKFVPKAFSSDKPVKSNIVIDLNKQTIKVPEVNRVEPDSIFHHALFASPEVRLEKWIKELCSYRQKALQQGWKNE
ncbi:hypothetical protein HUJ04_005616 [Dendroctonus ponderosae]|uniref:Uncharacterized protein n=1 Tax=Dendroctonus ponderosae TaxID=77166 RepID=A0AAR5Q1M7_DENPD|nr:hypothetical protein HUJ04_005616 [Dendroctonus ponderosae]